MTHTLGVASIGKRISGDAVLRSTFLTAADAAGLIPPSLSLPPFRLPPFLLSPHPLSSALFPRYTLPDPESSRNLRKSA